MTEEEAKTKLCPASFQAGIARSNLDCRCVASACMAWRIIPSPTSHNIRLIGRQDLHDPNLTIVESAAPEGVPQGYCGLAGKR